MQVKKLIKHNKQVKGSMSVIPTTLNKLAINMIRLYNRSNLIKQL